MKKIILLLLVSFLVYNINAQQDTLRSSPPLSASTSTSIGSGITFNVHAYKPINILEFATTTTSGTSGYEVWYNTDSINGQPVIDAANGWVLHEAGSISTAGTPHFIQLTNPLPISGGETYGIFLKMVGSSIYYASNPSPTVFSDKNLRLEVSNAGYSGLPPTPTIHPRGFAGQIVYEIAVTSINNAAVLSVDSPITFCSGFNDVYATIGNYGLNQINSVEVHWEVNGVTMPVIYYGQLLDTLNGNFPNTAQILLGNVNLNAGLNTIKVFTVNPNGSPDQFSSNDTTEIIIKSASAPTAGLAFQNIGMNSVDVNILDGAGNYDYEYGLTGFTLGTGTFGSTNSSMFTISGINHSTSYDVYIRTNCGSGDVSAWVGPFSFYTAAGTPFFQDFENFGSNVGIANIEGWNNTATAAPEWQTGTSTTSTGTGPEEDHTIGLGGTFAFLETTGGSLGDFDSLISPPIYIDNSTTSLTLEFWYHMFGADMGNLEVYIDTNGVTQVIDTIFGQQQTNQFDPWLLYSTQLTGYAGSNIRIIFKGVRGNGFTSDMAVDDIRVMKTPSCIRPTSLSASNITFNSADLSWQEKNVATQWLIEYGIKGFIPGNGTDTLVNSNPFTIGGLSANTEYEFYVRSVCGRGDSSIWEGPFVFVTTCMDVSSFPYLEDFDGPTTANVWNCWTVDNIDGGDTWVQANTYITAHSGLYTAHGMGNNNDMLISPRFNLPATPMWLKLWDIVESSTQNSIYSVLVSTTGMNVSDFTDTLATFNVTNENWTERTIDLSAYANQNIYIALWQSFSASTAWAFAVDDFQIQVIPSCIKPTDFTASNATLTSVDIAWTENNVATQWEIEYDTAGFTLGTGNRSLTANNPITLTGLLNGPYFDFYVRSICGRGDTSIWAGPFNFKTLTYSVTTTPPLTNNNGQSGVSFNVGASVDLKVVEILNSFNSGAIPYTIWYSTDSINGAPNIANSNNWIQHQTGIVNGTGTSLVGVPLVTPIEIPAGEVYGFFIEAGTGYHTNAVGDPTFFTDGNLHINTGSNVGYGGPPPNPTFHIRQFVGTVVYELNPKSNDNAGVASIDSLLAICAGPQDVYATIINDGLNQIDSVEVHWEVNGVVQSMVHYKQLLDTANGLFADSASILLGNANIVSGNNTIKVWTSMPNGVADTINTNDTILVNLVSPSAPTDILFSNIGFSSTDVEVVGSFGTIEYEYGPSSFTLGSGTRGITATNPFSINGLSGGPNFDFYARSICGPGDTSVWAGPFSFRTLTYSVSTAPPLVNNNSSGGITFNVGAHVNLKVTEIQNMFLAGNIPYTIWYSTDSINGQPNITTANGWIQYQSGNVNGVTGVQVGVQLNTPIEMEAGDVYGFHIEANTSYQTLASGPTVFTDANLHINTGTNVGYGGPAPTPPNHVRQFLGTVVYELNPKSNNNAGVESVDSVLAICAGPQDVYATIVNDGLNRIDSVEVHWEVNGTPQSMVHYKQLLDTANGTLPSSASILLGTANMVSGNNTVTVWTSMPNGVIDTLTGNDTAKVSLFSPSAPLNAVFSNITTTAADVNVIGVSGTIEYEYGLSGFTLGNGTSGNSATSPFTMSGLIPGTLYDVYLRNNCGSGTSSWAGPFSFMTSIAIPYLQDFENFGSNLSGINDIEGWNNTATAAPEWETGTTTSSTSTGPIADHTIGTGGTFIYLECSGGSLGDFDSLISPSIYVDTGITSLTLEFWYHMYGSTMGDLEVYMESNGVTTLVTTIVGQQQTAETDPWLQYSTQLTGYAGSSVRLIFKGIRGSNYYSDMSIDDVRLMETPAPCAGKPGPVTISGYSSVCSGVGFSLDAVGATLELGISYDWQYYDSSASAWISTGGTGLKENVSGIVTPTSYRLITSCSNSGLSDTSNVFYVALKAPNQCYCEPIYTTGCTVGDDIRSVIVNGANGTSINDLNTFCSQNSYDDKTNLPAVELVAGQTYNASINSNYTALSEYAKVWIDFNDDGVFDNVAEFVGQVGPFSTALVPFDISIPLTVDTGLHRMRVRSVWNGTTFAFDACSSESYGEVHDYMVDIVTIPIDVSLNKLVSPTLQSCYTSTENVLVELVNTGWNPLDFTVDSTLITVDVTGANTQHISFMLNNNTFNNGSPLAKLDTLLISVGTVDMTNPGTYYFDVAISSTNDGLVDNNNYNDSLEGSRTGKLIGASTLCTGDSATLFITGHRGNLQWQMNSGAGFVDIVGATANSVKVGPMSSTDYRAVVCGTLISDTTTVNPVTPSLPVATDSLLTVICGNNGIVAVTASSTNPNAKFEWYTSLTGGDALRLGGSIFDISQYGDTLYYQSNPSQNSPIIDTLYVQEVVLSGSGICASSRDSSIITIDCIVGLEGEKELNVSNISIHPNPSSGIFNIVGNNLKEEVEISIYNTNGKLIYHSPEKFTKNFEERIDLSEFAKGLYFIKLQSESSLETKKILLQ